jgi:hypothetical protein
MSRFRGLKSADSEADRSQRSDCSSIDRTIIPSGEKFITNGRGGLILRMCKFD